MFRDDIFETEGHSVESKCLTNKNRKQIPAFTLKSLSFGNSFQMASDLNRWWQCGMTASTNSWHLVQCGPFWSSPHLETSEVLNYLLWWIFTIQGSCVPAAFPTWLSWTFLDTKSLPSNIESDYKICMPIWKTILLLSLLNHEDIMKFIA